MDKDRIERAAIRAVEDYIDHCPKLVPNILSNDKTPIWDGEIYAYNDEKHTVKNFFARIPLQIKGTTDTKEVFYIKPEYVEGYKSERGSLFFMVQVDANGDTSKILYAILSLDRIDELLKKTNDNIRIDLMEVPADPLELEKELFAFAAKRNGEMVEKSSPEEITIMVEGFEEIREYLNEIEDKDVRIELELYLDSIKNLKAEPTIGWRDKFIYYSRKALDFASNNLKSHNFTNLQHNFGLYLFYQKQYHLVEDYYLKSFVEYYNQKDVVNVANTLNNLGLLHNDINRKDESEREYKKALEIRRELAKINRDAYIGNVAYTLNNLAVLHKNLTRFKDAELEYREALEICRELAKTNRDSYIRYVAMTLNNLGELHWILTRYEESEQELQEALKIRRELAKTNRDSFIADVAMTLNNLAILHYSLTHYDKAERECNEALKIRRELAKTNRDSYIGCVASTLNNLAILHYSLTRYDEAEREYKESLKNRRELAKSNRNADIADVATTLNNLAVLHKKLTRYDEAKQEFQEALEIRRELAEINNDAYIADVATTLSNLANLHDTLNQYAEAEKEWMEALKIRRELAKTNRDVYIGYVAKTLTGLAILLQKDEKRLDDARDAANEALGIYKELAKKYPQIWKRYVEDIMWLLEYINQIS